MVKLKGRAEARRSQSEWSAGLTGMMQHLCHLAGREQFYWTQLSSIFNGLTNWRVATTLTCANYASTRNKVHLSLANNTSTLQIMSQTTPQPGKLHISLQAMLQPGKTTPQLENYISARQTTPQPGKLRLAWQTMLQPGRTSLNSQTTPQPGKLSNYTSACPQCFSLANYAEPGKVHLSLQTMLQPGKLRIGLQTSVEVGECEQRCRNPRGCRGTRCCSRLTLSS